jgi:hypothetical protein
MDRKAEEEAIAELSATTTTPRAAVLDAAGRRHVISQTDH